MRTLLIASALILLQVCSAQPMLFVWPQPAFSTFGSAVATLDRAAFAFELSASTPAHPILSAALKNHQNLIFNYPAVSKFIDQYEITPPNAIGSIAKLVIQVANTTNDALVLGVDESYTLSIPTPSNGQAVNAQLSAKTIYGALHGLETFSQLVDYNGTNWIVGQLPITINDKPRFPWRGFLMDCSRHYHPLWSIKHIIDSIAHAKLNVLHWHLTDAESFPIEIASRPEMAQKGAWDTDSTYSAADVQEIIKYGQFRGVRVVPEIDTPGHSYSWGKAYPDIVVNCPTKVNRDDYLGINNVPLDMTKDATYPVVKDVYQGIASMFSDDYIHLGGDELATGCLDADPNIKIWMEARNMTDYDDLVRYYRYNLTSYVTAVNKKMVVWQEAYEEMQNQPANPLTPENTIVQVWKNDNALDSVYTAISKGYKTLISAGWYLDQQVPSIWGTTHYLFQDTWMDFYSLDPTTGLSIFNTTQEMLDNVIGGEACQWGETANPYNIDGNVWARTSAAAERLWSPASANSTTEAYYRLIRFQCYILQRGVRTSPFRPNHCPSPLLDSYVIPPPAIPGTPSDGPTQAPQEDLGSTIVQVPVWAIVIAGVLVFLSLSVAVGLSIRMCLANKRSSYDRA